MTVIVLLWSSFSACAFATSGTTPQKGDHEILSSENTGSQASSQVEYTLLAENFTDGNIPPQSEYGIWELHQTNLNETWYRDSTYPYTNPYCATVHRGNSTMLQDEWLITPSLNFSGYDEVHLEFHWYTCFHVTVWSRIIEFNISISTDGGTSWSLAWCFDDMDIEFFSDWVWYNTIYNNIPIDLSDYAGAKNVKIAFQYSSDSLEHVNEQEFSIDEIEVIGRGEPQGTILECSAGGPYNWYWPIQFNYRPYGVRFSGSVTNESMFYTQMVWDFGDGNTSNTSYNLYPYHFYNDDGDYNITLTVIDYSTNPPRRANASTILHLFTLPPPQINITVQRISLGVIAYLRNDAEYSAINANYSINVSFGFFQRGQKTVLNGTIEEFKAGSTEKIQSPVWFLGFFRLHVVISVSPLNIPGWVQHFDGVKIGPMIIIINNIHWRNSLFF